MKSVFAKDKKIFIILGIIIVFVLYYNFFYRNQFKEIGMLRSVIEAYNDKGQINEEVRRRVENMDGELKILNEKLNVVRAMFPPEINHDVMLIILRDIAKKNGLIIDNMAFSGIEQVNYKEKTDHEKTGEQKDQSAQEEQEFEEGYKRYTSLLTKAIEIKEEKLKTAAEILGITTEKDKEKEDPRQKIADGKGFLFKVNISSRGTNSQIKGFLRNVKELKNKTVLKTLTIENIKEGQLSANFELEFYGIMDRKAAQKGSYLDMTWEPLESADRDNIFKPYKGYQGPMGGVADNEQSESKNSNKDNTSKDLALYDFTMRVIPFGANMAPPTVSLVGKSVSSGADNLKFPVIYGDSRGNEKAEIYLEQKDGKFFCKFKTGHDSFPDFGYKDLVEFNPSGDEIKILVDSTKRVSQKDNSGVILSVINKTGKKLTIDVLNDDLERPRVVIKKITENISVNYEW